MYKLFLTSFFLMFFNNDFLLVLTSSFCSHKNGDNIKLEM